MGLDKVRQTAFNAARQAGTLLKTRLGNIKSIDYKSAFNIVTDVDKASENAIIEILHQEFPDFGTLAEEGGLSSTGSAKRWLIDPLDGTTNYTHGYPFFCVSIGFEDSGQMQLGVVYNPISQELFWAEKSQGAWLNDQLIHVSSTGSLSESLLATGFPPDTQVPADDNMARFATLTAMSHGVRRDGSAALDLCFVASGRLQGFWEIKLSPWDTAAGAIIVTEAGGKVTNLTGESFDMSTGYILATNGLIHQEVIHVLRQVDKSAGSAKTSTQARRKYS
ncbi:MAG: inositol monophosphatase [Candidatus Melainabacteria bacterium]|nr:inositol monophosphatase [Candidatus Melainabacteria bacterium]